MSNNEMRQLLARAQSEMRLKARIEQAQNELADQQIQHQRDAELIRLKAQNDLFMQLLSQRSPVAPPELTSSHRIEPADPATTATRIEQLPAVEEIKLERVVTTFLEKYLKGKNAAMAKKHSAVLPLLLQVIGNKPIASLRQADLNHFFSVVLRLPPRWLDVCRQKKVSAVELAKVDHEVTIAPKTFKDTYLASVRPFLLAAKRDWMDQGFPERLTTDGIAYEGNRKAGENKQRPIRDDELRAIFESSMMRQWMIDPSEQHRFWLPCIAYYTGARVNEICQLNPSTDIAQQNGIWYFNFTDEGETDAAVVKSIKNDVSVRRVPFHPKLVELGLPSYVKSKVERGDKLIFAEWQPSGGKASKEADKWFRNYLAEIDVRDETPHKRLVGMHAFRSTFLNRALESTPSVEAVPITGHAGDKSKVLRGYEGEMSLEKKLEILNAIHFSWHPRQTCP